MKIENISAIYKITNPTNEIYIGQTNDWKRRFNQYRLFQCKTQKLIHESIITYGWENHKIELLEYCIEESVDEREIYYITLNNSYYKDNLLGLNMTRGGKDKYFLKQVSNNNIGRSGSTEFQRKKIKEIHNIPILQYDLEGNFIKEWESATMAVEILNLNKCNISNIRSCANFNKNFKQSCGFIWRDKINDEIPLKIQLPIFKKYFNCKIKCTNLVTNHIILFNSVIEANKHFKTNVYDVIECQKGIMPKRKLKFEIVNNFILSETSPSNT